MKISGIFKKLASVMLAGAVCSGMSALAAPITTEYDIRTDTAGSSNTAVGELTEEGKVTAVTPMAKESLNSLSAFKSDVVTVGVRGRYYTTAAEALARVNEIRLEACKEGLVNPANPSKKLTLTDYQPLRWSSELETIARQRAAEACIRRDHVRPNDRDTFTLSMPGSNKEGEVLAWNGYQNMLYGIQQFYDEKEDYVYGTDKESGHYKILINPEYTHIGLAGFFSVDCGVSYSSFAGRLYKSKSPLDGKYGPYVDDTMVSIKVKSKYLSAPELVCTTGKTGAQIKGTSLKYEMCSTTTIDGEKGKVYYVGDIKWTSSNTKVATVTNGVVKAIGVGTTTITAYSSLTGATAKMTVEVIPVTLSVTLDRENLNLEVGKTGTLKATVLPQEAPNKTLRWKTSNSNVVTVNNGKLTAKNVGTATITATAVNGAYFQCVVTVTRPPSKVSLNKTSTTIGVGESEQLEAILPAHSTEGDFIWRSSNSAVVVVTDGKIKAQQKGSATITVKTYNGKIATCNVTVKAAPTSITLNQKKIDVGIGESLTLKSTIPVGSASGSRRWTSSNENALTVDNGKVKALKEGNSIVIVRTYNGKSAACSINVKKAPLSVKFASSETVIGVGESVQLDPVFREGYASFSNTWKSSNTAVAKVVGGTVTAVKAGTATITMTTFNGKKASCIVRVKNAPSKITLDKTSLNMGVGENVQLNYSLPQGSASSVITWSSNSSKVTVKDGKVTAQSEGTATITVKTYNGKIARCKVTVKAAPGWIKLNETKKIVGVGETVQLRATIPSGSASSAIRWTSSDDDILTVQNGLVKSVGVGVTTINARTYNGKLAMCSFVVRNAPDSIEFSSSEIALGVGEKLTITPVLPSNTASDKLTWSTSNSGVVAVKSGVLTAKAAGEATIKVKTFNGKTASCKVTVQTAPSEFSLSVDKIDLGAGERYQLSASMPKGTASATITWTSSDDSVVSVDDTGKLTAYKTGSAVITAKTFNGVTAECSVTVKEGPSSVKISETKIFVGKGESVTLKAILPAKTASANITWTSNNTDVATVSDGTVKAVGIGTAIIIVKTFNGVKASCPVVVREAPTQLSVSSDKKTLGVGETVYLDAVLPANEASYKLTWASGNKAIVAASKGKVVAKATGTTIVSVKTYNGLRAVCNVTVKKAPDKVTLNKTSRKMGVGETFQLTAKLPEGTASDSMVWTTSSKKVADVDATGKITAMGTGTATITVTTFNGKSATCKVTVKRAPAAGDISVSDIKVYLGKGESFQLSASLASDTASEFRWMSNAEDIAKVSSNGKVTTYSAGSAIISVRTYNNIKAVTSVVVREEPTDLTLSEQAVTMAMGEKAELTAKFPAGTYARIKWTSSDESVVKVNDGVVESVGLGKAVVKAELYNGISRSCSFEILNQPDSISLSKSKLILGEGETYQLDYILPEGSISNVIDWSTSDESVVTVNGGKLKAVGTGSAKVTVTTFNSKSAVCDVTVRFAPSDGDLSISDGQNDVTNQRVFIGVGETLTLKSVLPSDCAGELAWKSTDETLFSVENGKLTGITPGAAAVTLRAYNGVIVKTYVSVKEAPESVSFDEEAIDMGVGEQVELAAKLPYGSSSAITWTSSNTKAATVKEGVITAVAGGTAVIKAKTYNGKTASCTVNVSAAPNSITLSAARKTIGTGESIQLDYTLPAGTASHSIIWSSSNESVATVKNGKVTASSANVGTTVITVTAFNGTSASCTVTVKNRPTEITLTETDRQLVIGETFDLGVVFLQDEASDKITWTSYNEDIATVDNGKVTAVGTGAVYVVARTFNGIAAKCRVAVKAQ